MGDVEKHKSGTYPNLGGGQRTLPRSESKLRSEGVGGGREGEGEIRRRRKEQHVQSQGVGTQCLGKLK